MIIATLILSIVSVILCICAILSQMDLLRKIKETDNCLTNASAALESARNEADVLLNKNNLLTSDIERITAENDELRQALRAALTAPPAAEPQQEPEERCEKAAASPSLVPVGIATNMYCCEPYNKFAKNSDQAILQEDCFTDTSTGIRYLLQDGKKYLCAAIATAYGTEIGRTFAVRLENGNSFDVIVSDFKHPIDNVRVDDFGDACANYDGEDALCILEFVVDLTYVPKAVKDAGTMSALEFFGGLHGHGGNITEITNTGRRWKA